MKKLSKKIITGNYGSKVECWIGLEKGDELLCIKTERGLLDVGTSSVTIEFDSFIKDRIYKVDHIYNWDGSKIAYVKDEDNCCTWATTALFEPVKNKFEKRKDVLDKLLGKIE